MVAHAQFDSSSLLTGQNKEFPSQEMDLLTSLGKCTKQKSSLVKMAPSLFIAGVYNV